MAAGRTAELFCCPASGLLRPPPPGPDPPRCLLDLLPSSGANHTRLQGGNPRKTPWPISPNFPLIFHFFFFFFFSPKFLHHRFPEASFLAAHTTSFGKNRNRSLILHRAGGGWGNGPQTHKGVTSSPPPPPQRNYPITELGLDEKNSSPLTKWSARFHVKATRQDLPSSWFGGSRGGG